jgi:alcohol dehydrogenase (cytochrome c)
MTTGPKPAFRPILVAVVTAGLILAAQLGMPSSPARADGLFDVTGAGFTAAQAARGVTAYVTNCQSCHGEHLNDGTFGPPLAGASFHARWHGRSAATLLAFIQAKMPPSAVESLGARTYADIAAYLLQANGEVEGVHELDASAQQHQPEFAGGDANEDATFVSVTAARADKLGHISPVTDAMLRHPGDGDWLNWRRTYASTGYSPLSQINTKNANALRVAWSWGLPLGPDEITPLIHDGVLFIESGNQVQALDGATGDLLWRYARTLPDSFHNGVGEVIRGLAIYHDRIFAPTADGHLIALDLKTGALIWDHEILEAADTAHIPTHGSPLVDGSPLVVNGKVIEGVSGCHSYKGGCFIVALDSATGQEVWRFNTIARPGEPGGDSWNGTPLDHRFGGSVWTSGSYDPALNLLYYGVGQTYDTATLLQPGPTTGASADALYTDSTVALDPDTGKLVWFYQHLNRDVWDFDWVFERTLIDLPHDGRPRHLLITGGKIGIFDTLDRVDGKYVTSEDLGLQNLITGIDPRTGAKTINPALTPEANKTRLVCPHAGGVRSWLATAYDARTRILYVPMVESCMDFTWVPRDASQTAAGGSDIHWTLRPRPDSDGKFGRVEAINVQTGKVMWIRRRRAPEASSILATAGGLVFEGDRDRIFRASDAQTGRLLWATRLNAVPSSTPVTYAIGGHQYVAVVAGGGGSIEVTWSPLTPEIRNPDGATTLWVFRLP